MTASEFDEWWARHVLKDCTVWVLTYAAFAGVIVWLSIVENQPGLRVGAWILLTGLLQPLARAGQYRYDPSTDTVVQRSATHE